MWICVNDYLLHRLDTQTTCTCNQINPSLSYCVTLCGMCLTMLLIVCPRNLMDFVITIKGSEMLMSSDEGFKTNEIHVSVEFSSTSCLMCFAYKNIFNNTTILSCPKSVSLKRFFKLQFICYWLVSMIMIIHYFSGWYKSLNSFWLLSYHDQVVVYSPRGDKGTWLSHGYSLQRRSAQSR